MSAQRLLVEGRYALWMGAGNMLYRRDIIAGVTTPIAGAGNNLNSLAANGDVAFWSGYQIHRYRDGQITRLTTDADLWNVYPVTDGINVVYKKTTPCCDPRQYRIAMHDGTREILLTEVFTWPEPAPVSSYNANGGWVAFRRYGTSSSFATWIRTPAGEEHRATTEDGMQALGPDGQVVVRNGLYRYPYTSAPLKYASAFGSTRFIGDRMYFVLGRHVFGVVR